MKFMKRSRPIELVESDSYVARLHSLTSRGRLGMQAPLEAKEAAPEAITRRFWPPDDLGRAAPYLANLRWYAPELTRLPC